MSHMIIYIITNCIVVHNLKIFRQNRNKYVTDLYIYKQIYMNVFQVLYCDACRESCHPKRGPLATHNLGPPRGSWQSNGGGKGVRGSNAETTPLCTDHNGEPLTLYCALCKIAICALCLRDRHAAHPHDVLPLAAACKAQKASIFNVFMFVWFYLSRSTKIDECRSFFFFFFLLRIIQ